MISLGTNALSGDNAFLKLTPPVDLATPEEHLQNNAGVAYKDNAAYGALGGGEYDLEGKRDYNTTVVTEDTPLISKFVCV